MKFRRVEWRAVGVDVTGVGGDGLSREEGEWHDERNAAIADAEDLASHTISYDDVFIERRVSDVFIEKEAIGVAS